MLVTLVRRGALFVLLGATASPAALAQTVVSGTVRDDRNAPLSGAAVAVRGSRIGVMANDAGRYRLVIPPEIAGSDSVILIARRVGFDAVTKRVAAGTSVTVDFVLKASTVRLEAAVVTGAAEAIPSRAGSDAKERPRTLATPSPSEAEEKRDVRSRLADSRASARADASQVGGRRGGQEPRPGVLTAAAWDDAQHWSQYMRFVARAGENAWNPVGARCRASHRPTGAPRVASPVEPSRARHRIPRRRNRLDGRRDDVPAK